MIEHDKILVTGSAGFIGMHLCIRLLKQGYQVLGLDNLNNYYDPNLKKSRLKKLMKIENFTFVKSDIADLSQIDAIFCNFKPSKVVNLAAQAGVRYSLENPHAYISSNVSGFMNILECCRKYEVKGLVYASSSSVYGSNKKHPFSVKDRVDSPISIYAVTKRTNELMARTYSHLYSLNTTGLRFFTVYGPWGRPDMAMYIFTDKISKNKQVNVFNNGDMYRDFTYIDDIVDGIICAVEKNYKCELFNLGNNTIIKLGYIIKLIENSLNKKAKIKYLENQLGDVKTTFADITYSKKKLGYNPSMSIETGIFKFIEWFKKYKNSEFEI